ncbi:metallophosphoesterase [Lachnospiraceae bacterium OttesenSCG-928-D06]|nr:metallophosphoesterase [Lachnospiraceae bacterium OttesenSCG-928-D06]
MLDVIIVVIMIVMLVLLWIMLYDSNRFVVRNIVISDKRIKQQYKAVVLADLHNKQYGKDNKILLDAIYKQEADGIFIAGDLLTAKPQAPLIIAVSLLQKIGERYPVYYANGNHEYRLKLYPEKYKTMAVEYEKALEEIGIKRLVNEQVLLSQYNIQIYGSEIDKLYYKRFTKAHMDGDYLNQLLSVPNEESFNVLIAHNPDYFPQYAEWGADLVLSGHVHGGIVRIPFLKGVISPTLRLFPKYDGGIFKEKEKTMVLSRGLGMHTIPIRLFNPGELLVITLKPEEDA